VRLAPEANVVTPGNRRACVRRPVVNDDHFDRLIGLCMRAVDGSSQVGLAVEDWDDDADQR
jgi:hypothetical protein